MTRADDLGRLPGAVAGLLIEAALAVDSEWGCSCSRAQIVAAEPGSCAGVEHIDHNLPRLLESCREHADLARADERERLAWWLERGCDGPGGVYAPDSMLVALRQLADVLRHHPDRWADAPGTVPKEDRP